MTQSRREFVSSALLAGLGTLGIRAGQGAGARIEIFPGEPIGRISPNLYGHFVEHIGGVIYDGIWVGEDSRVPNEGGIRKALLESLKTIRPAVMRWPGGCFADSYDWRDGIGPRSKRPRRANFWINDLPAEVAARAPQRFEPNQFGTHEFARFCRLSGAQPYLAANLRSQRPQDFYQWIEYCNAPAGAGTLSDQRAANGDEEPFAVRYWGVGNESWGCGGNFRPEEYAREYRRFVSWAPKFGVPLSFIGAGPNEGDLEWTRRFFATLVERDREALRSMWGWALHYYCGIHTQTQALTFTVPEWYDLLTKAAAIEDLIVRHWAAMGEIDPGHQVKLVVDEWGAWHASGSEVDKAYLFCQVPALRDALVSALTLDVFNRHADKIGMATVAQLINNLHCLFLAREDKFTVTPNYHVFQMYTAHQGGTSLRTEFAAPKLANAALPALSGSASIQGKTIVLTVVNPHATDACEAEIAVRGGTVTSLAVTELSSSDIHAHNTFDAPAALEPKDVAVRNVGGAAVHRFPPASVTKAVLTLA